MNDFDALLQPLFRRTFDYFFPDAELLAAAPTASTRGISVRRRGTAYEITWRGMRYTCARRDGFSSSEHVLLQSMERVVSHRLAAATARRVGTDDTSLGRGTFEDRCIAAFVAPRTETVDGAIDEVLFDVIDVLRFAGSTTYENRRITTGVLVSIEPRILNSDAPVTGVRYSSRLVAIKAFLRLCDGFRTVAVVGSDGTFQDIIDLSELSGATRTVPLPVATQYVKHAHVTMTRNAVCFVLTSHGDIKVFRHGIQVAALTSGRWQLTEWPTKYARWRHLVTNADLADRLLTTALNLSETRRGAMFVVLDQATDPHLLISETDALSFRSDDRIAARSKQALHYLLHSRNSVTMPAAVLENVAAMDGAVLVRADGELIAIGALLRANGGIAGVEGARTVAAINASMRAVVLKVSEDGGIALLANGRTVWEL